MEQAQKKTIITKALKGNKDAIYLIDCVAFIARIWDNLVDGDPVTKDDLNRSFWLALVEMPQNPFFNHFQGQITALLRDYINNWMDANEYEKTGDLHKKTLSFVLRDMIGGIVSQCAYLIGGYDWMREVSPEIRSIQFEETLTEYMEGLNNGSI